MNKDRFSTFRKKLRELHIKNNIHLPGEQKRYLKITIITAKTTKNKTTCVYCEIAKRGGYFIDEQAKIKEKGGPCNLHVKSELHYTKSKHRGERTTLLENEAPAYAGVETTRLLNSKTNRGYPHTHIKKKNGKTNGIIDLMIKKKKT